MKKNIFRSALLLFLCVFVCSSCQPEEVKPDCEIRNYGTITISNSSSNPYDIFVDGVFQQQLGGGRISGDIRINGGNDRSLYAKQVSGFVLFPTEKSTTFNVVSCSSYTWQIP